ncbi:MAG: glucose 1-dehydrogenase [bacterium]|nr:glucose 1-dehydrogenase [bacterium]
MPDSARPLFSLQDRVAVITGAGSGIGRSIARVYASAGAEVWALDVNEQSANETASGITDSGGRAHAQRADVTNPESLGPAVKNVLSQSGRIDILVNNAGVGFVGDLLNTPEEEYDRLMNVNARGVFLMTRAALPSMLERGGGVIVNIASIASLIAVKDRFAYCASKGAVMMMTKSIAMDYVGKGIRCNCICPTRIHTPFVDDYLSKNYPGRESEVFAQLSAYQPIGRMGSPDEVAWLALYLASDEGAMHTGDAFPLSGGKLMG